MKRSILVLVALTFILTGCSVKLGKPKETAYVMPTPTLPALEEDAEQIYRPTLVEIQNQYDLSSKFSSDKANLVVLKDDRLWQEMKLQLVAYVGKDSHDTTRYCRVYAVLGNNEKLIDIKPYWGSYVFDYVMADLDQDGQTEMVGFYDWGSGIVRSVPFVLLASGDFADIAYVDKTQSETNQPGLYEYKNLSVAEDGKSITADAQSVMGSNEIESVSFYFENGAYRYRYS